MRAGSREGSTIGDAAFLSSPHNPRIKRLVRLRDRPARDDTGLFPIDGLREVERARQAGIELLEVYFPADGPEQRVPAPIAALTARETFAVLPEIFARIAYGERRTGVVAVARRPDRGLAAFRPGAGEWLLVLEGVEKPGNLGAVFRSADGAGAGGILIADPRTDLFNPNAVRASLGTIFAVPCAVATREAVTAWLTAAGYRIWITRPEARLNFTEAPLAGPTAIVLGSEAFGLLPAWDRLDAVAVSIPMRGLADSLNLSVAAALLGYEMLRRRG